MEALLFYSGNKKKRLYQRKIQPLGYIGRDDYFTSSKSTSVTSWSDGLAWSGPG